MLVFGAAVREYSAGVLRGLCFARSDAHAHGSGQRRENCPLVLSVEPSPEPCASGGCNLSSCCNGAAQDRPWGVAITAARRALRLACSIDALA